MTKKFQNDVRKRRKTTQNKKSQKEISKQEFQKTENSLHKYWDEYFQRECRTRQNRRNFKRWKREELLKWDAEEYGIKNQKWSQFSADLIGRGDFEDYFSVLEARAKKANGGLCRMIRPAAAILATTTLASVLQPTSGIIKMQDTSILHYDPLYHATYYSLHEDYSMSKLTWSDFRVTPEVV